MKKLYVIIDILVGRYVMIAQEAGPPETLDEWTGKYEK